MSDNCIFDSSIETILLLLNLILIFIENILDKLHKCPELKFK